MTKKRDKRKVLEDKIWLLKETLATDDPTLKNKPFIWDAMKFLLKSLELELKEINKFYRDN